ncbi:spore coat protein D [Bacillus timonensis]|uniref:Spore coat protein D n=1 Tax=Bacillus timonensis TaxID=1033734 RepID=A0A4S3PTE5_9BACI|nr:spore coat protein D [Bacillus timonensis]THE13020.1 spore coat protein D [Bacillus timonensis]
MNRTRPVYFPPKYRVRNEYVRRVHPIIQPIVEVNRINVIDVPKRIIQPIRRTEVVHHRRRY